MNSPAPPQPLSLRWNHGQEPQLLPTCHHLRRHSGCSSPQPASEFCPSPGPVHGEPSSMKPSWWFQLPGSIWARTPEGHHLPYRGASQLTVRAPVQPSLAALVKLLFSEPWFPHQRGGAGTCPTGSLGGGKESARWRGLCSTWHRLSAPETLASLSLSLHPAPHFPQA